MYEPKDLKRIEDIKRKASDIEKQVSLANHMSNLITDREKCYRRAEAAEQVFGKGHAVVEVFLRRWHVLNGIGLMAAPLSVAPVAPKVKEVEKVIEMEAVFGSTLPLTGSLEIEDQKLKNGATKGILEIWQTWSMQIVHIYRPGEVPEVQIQAIANFNDEDNNFLFGGRMIDWTNSLNKEAAVKKYGAPVQKKVYA
jgi:hypothetical protein